METFFPFGTQHRNCLFKSYYVVWKPVSMGFFANIPKRFKSYYVVWKLFSMLMTAFLFASFKSYYVVWKPQVGSEEKKSSQRGLNRTMQYGNKRGYEFECADIPQFKSYYVVWKL